MIPEVQKAFNVFHSEEILTNPGEPRNFSSSNTNTYAVMLGSGKPEPTPFRFGPGGAIISNQFPYIIDAGEGIWRAIAKAAISHNKLLADFFAPKKLTKLFLTHLHSDHTVGLVSLLLLPWVHGRKQPIDIFGPIGTKKLVELTLEAHKADIEERVYGPEKKDDSGWRAQVFEIDQPGIFYQDLNISVEAFHHPHGGFKQNFGYLFKSTERSIAWAGDGIFSSNYKEVVEDVDVLFSDITPPIDKLGDTPWRESDKEISKMFHMQPKTLGELAENCRVKKLVLHHEQNYSDPYDPDALVNEVKKYYKGVVISARDGDIF